MWQIFLMLNKQETKITILNAWATVLCTRCCNVNIIEYRTWVQIQSNHLYTGNQTHIPIRTDKDLQTWLQYTCIHLDHFFSSFFPSLVVALFLPANFLDIYNLGVPHPKVHQINYYYSKCKLWYQEIKKKTYSLLVNNNSLFRQMPGSENPLYSRYLIFHQKTWFNNHACITSWYKNLIYLTISLQQYRFEFSISLLTIWQLSNYEVYNAYTTLITFGFIRIVLPLYKLSSATIVFSNIALYGSTKHLQK